jgi:hypothetical protein
MPFKRKIQRYRLLGVKKARRTPKPGIRAKTGIDTVSKKKKIDAKAFFHHLRGTRLCIRSRALSGIGLTELLGWQRFTRFCG